MLAYLLGEMGPSSTAGGNVDSFNLFRKQYGTPFKTKNLVSIRPQNTILKKHLCFYIYCNTIHNSQRLEKPQIPKNRWLYKEIMLYILLYHKKMEYYLIIRKEEVMKFAALWMVQKSIIPNKVWQRKRGRHCFFSYTGYKVGR